MKKLSLDTFIEKANKKHNNKYVYDKVNYINSRTKVIIICKIHGEFLQTPSNHLRHGCLHCSGKSPITAEEFKIKLYNYFPNIKLIGEYKNSYTKIIIQDELGILYKSTPIELLNLHPPSIITAIDKNKAFAIKANKIHDYKFDYSLVDYKNNRTKVKIICPEHGVFEQIAGNHLLGANCRKCDGGGWSKTRWINLCSNYKNKDPRLYIIKCFNENEQFIKIGITSKLITVRFPNKNVLPYFYETIKEIKGSPDFIWNKEKELHKLFKNFKYKPLISFNGETECFSTEILQYLF